MEENDSTRSQLDTVRSWVHLARVATGSGEVVRVDGWVFTETGEPLTEVRAVAAHGTSAAAYPLPRPDVAAAYPAASHSRMSGFALQLPGPPRTRFKLRFEARSPNQDWQVFFKTTVEAADKTGSLLGRLGASRESSVTELPHPAFYLWFDEPLDWTKLPRRFRLSGWCFSRNREPIEAVRVRIGRREFAGSYGIFRADVAQMHSEDVATFKSGFDIIAEAPRGRAIFVLEIRMADGQWQEIFSKKISAPWINLRPIDDSQLWEIGNYGTWIKRYDTLRPADRREIRAHIARLAARPLISIVMPVYNPAAAHLRSAIKSVRAQLYPHWELCIVDDASPAKHVRQLLARYARCDPRIKVQRRASNGGIAAASNDALALTTGEYVALLDDDDVLAPTALYFVACELNAHPDAQLLYSDEDKLDPTGQRGNPHFKPDWDWQLFLAQNFFSHLGVFKAELIKQAGFRAGFEGSQDYDLVLRCAEQVERNQIQHLPRVLYHWRMSDKSAALNINAKPHARAAAIKAVEEHLARRGVAAEVTSSGDEDFRRIRYLLPNDKPRVAIIILTRDLVELLQPCVESILGQTIYPSFQLVLLDNGSTEEAALSFLSAIERDSRVRVLRHAGEFNFGRLNNFVVQNVEAEFVALLNNDLTVINPDWLEEMVGQALQPRVGAVGARLLYPDDRIQHAGVILGGGGVAAHAHKGLPRANHGYFSRAILAQELSAVTAACLLVRRSAYLEVGGFAAEELKIAFNDVDFCLRLRAHGYRIIYTPYAEFYHHESASRGLEDTVAKNARFEAEIKYMHDTWGDALLHDSAYNPNFSLLSADFTLAFPPRTSHPWKK